MSSVYSVWDAPVDNLLNEEDYYVERERLTRALQNLRPPDTHLLLMHGLQLTHLNEYLAEATETEQSELIALLFQATYFDLESGTLRRFLPAPDFLLLFQMAAQTMGWQVTSEGEIVI